MVVTHHAYGLVKMPGRSAILTVRCDEKDSMHTLEHAYMAASTMYPADEDVPGPAKEATTKKKPLLCQERAKSEKASLHGGEAAPSLAIRGGPSPK